VKFNATGLTARHAVDRTNPSIERTMNRQVSLALGMCCLIAAAVLGYVAFDSYKTAADKVEAQKELLQGPIVGRLLPGLGQGLEPTTPATTKICGAIAAGTAVAGIMFLFLAASAPRKSPPMT
jgi:hypothetical protein